MNAGKAILLRSKTDDASVQPVISSAAEFSRKPVLHIVRYCLCNELYFKGSTKAILSLLPTAPLKHRAELLF